MTLPTSFLHISRGLLSELGNKSRIVVSTNHERVFIEHHHLKRRIWVPVAEPMVLTAFEAEALFHSLKLLLHPRG